MKSTIQQRLLRLPRPDMTPFAGLFLVIGCFFLLSSNLKAPPKGLVSLEETPRTLCNACSNVPDHTQIYVCLTTSGRLSFSVSEPALQQAVLKQVSKKYDVHFSADGLASLKSVAFVAVRFERLPTMLATPTSTVSASQEVAGSFALTAEQMLDCVETARVRSLEVTNRPVGIFLSISAQTKASLVMQLLRLFQQHELNRLFLLTHCSA